MEPLKPVEIDVKSLLEMFEFFLTERHLCKSIEALGRCIRDMRIIIGRVVVDHFLRLSTAEEERFIEALATMLADRSAALPFDDDDGGKYYDYCIEQILLGFEYAQEIKESYSDDPVLQKILSLDIPILRPFDYGLKGKLKLVNQKKKKRVYG